VHAGHVVALALRVQPHLAGAEVGEQLLSGSFGIDRLHDLLVAQCPLRRLAQEGLS
jgi:hypothetical protein